ncbi:MAG: DUF4142 domain-containing protein [Rhodospirillales bacterium]|nr:MAG: DUF4142 domain-containing protein [Rhodospirillales bacterium]
MNRSSRRALLAAVAIAVAVPAFVAVPPAFAQSMDQTGGTTTFVRLASLGGHFGIESSQIALQRSRDPGVRGFAQRMIDSHGQALNDLKFTNDANANASMPQQLTGDYQAMINELRGTPDERFDGVYMSMQVQGHQTALAMFTDYARVGSVDSLRKLAVKWMPLIEANLKDAQTVLGAVSR